MDNDTAKQNGDGEFRRELGVWSACALVAGSMIGSGIFFFVSPVAKQLPSTLAILMAWTIGAAIAFCGSICLAELAAAYPQSGGIYVYLNRAFGPLVSFLYTWTKFLIMRIGSFGIPALLFAVFFCDFFSLTPYLPMLKKPIALAFILILTIVNIIGVATGGLVQNIFTAAKIICLLIMVGVGIAFAGGALNACPIEIKPATPIQGNFILLFCAALIPIMWTFGGWDESPFVAEEVKNPQRNLPISILGGFILVAILYIVVNAAYLAILSPQEMAASGDRTATLAMQRALGANAKQILSLFLMISTFGAANGMALTGARIAYATGRNQSFFQWLAHTHAKTKTPIRSLVLQCVLACAVILIMENPFDLLMYTGLAYWIFSGLMAVAVIVLRIRDHQYARPFKVWGYPLTPILFILASLGMVFSIMYESLRNSAITLIIFAIGIIVYLVQNRKQTNT